MSRRTTPTFRRAGALLSALAVALVMLGVQPVRAIAATTTPAAPAAVTVTLNAMSPRSPDARTPDQQVSFDVSITNTTDTTYTDVELGLQRGLPITQQHLLDEAIATPPATDYSIPNPLDTQKQLLPRQTLRLTYRTTANELCLCFNGVYPYALVVRAVSDPDAGFAEVGRTQVFIPSFQDVPKRVSVAWAWPLLDVPHRAVDTDVFTDESLAGEVGPGGRLDRALKVPELLVGKVRLTVIVDPDLLDDLAVMAAPAGYRVRKGTGTVPGTGGKLAAAWLARFKLMKAQHDVVLTAYADPDVNAVSRAGLKFSTALDTQVQARISATLNADFSSDLLSWPTGGALTGKALDTLVGSGASTILLSDASLPGQNKTEPRPDGVSPLPSAAGKAVALVTDSTIQATVNRALKLGATPALDQQLLLAQLAIRAEQQPAANHFVVITPDRYVNVSPAVAAATIAAVRGTSWSRPTTLRTALATVTPVDRGALQTNVEDPGAELSAANMSALATIDQQVASMSEALHNNDASAQLLGGFSNGIQRAESSAWRNHPAGGSVVLHTLQTRIDQITSAVHLVTPSGGGVYSLSSSNSPVVVTVSNELSRAVTVQVSVVPAISTAGFSTQPMPLQTIPAHSIATIRIPTHVERLGRFQVLATLRTPDGRQLGTGLTLSLRATAIGSVTKVITIVAVAVLVLALPRRFVRRIRHGRRPSEPLRVIAGATR